jgi:class 3 adenylate cyclase
MEKPPPDESHPALRITDADRNQAVELLRQHTAEGLLTLDEFSERAGLVFAARTEADLGQVMADLPAVRASVPAASRRRAKSWTVAIMSGSRRRGRWRPAPHTRALAIMGGCDLDLRQAEIDGDEIVITAVAIMGAVDIIVPEGIEVDMSGVPIMGGKDLKIADVPPTPGAPRVRVRAFPFMGGVTVRNKGLKEKVRSMVEGGDVAGAIGAATEARHQAHQHMHQAHHAMRQARRDARRGRWIDQPYDAWPEADVAQGDAATAEPETVTRPEELPTAPDGTVTILFSDIAGYTPMTERLGDLRAGELLATHNKIVRGQVLAHGGFEVKTQGDGFMVAFAGAGRALRCAIAIQQAFADRNSASPDERIDVHLGLHTGEAVRQGDDFLGRTVIMASRITAQARAGEILVSNLIHELAASSGEFSFGQPREVELKGISARQVLYPIVWSP